MSIVAVCAVVLGLSSWGQYYHPLWERTFDFGSSGFGDVATCVEWSEVDSSVVTTGYAFIGAGWNYVTVKLSNSGDTVWIDTITYYWGFGHFSQGLFVDDVGNILVSGSAYYDYVNYNVCSYCYDAEGVMFWQDSVDYGDGEFCFDITPTLGGWWFVGDITYPDSGKDIFFGRYNADWKVVVVDTIDVDSLDIALGVDADTLGNAFIAGFSSSDTTSSGIVMCVDSLGRLLWMDTLSLGWCVMRDVALIGEKVVVVGQIGSGESACGIVAYYTSWGLELGVDVLEGGLEFYGIADGGGGEFFVVGAVHSSGYRYPVAMKFDTLGNVLWRCVWERKGQWHDVDYQDGIVLFAGEMDTNITDYYICKMREGVNISIVDVIRPLEYVVIGDTVIPTVIVANSSSVDYSVNFRAVWVGSSPEGDTVGLCTSPLISIAPGETVRVMIGEWEVAGVDSLLISSFELEVSDDCSLDNGITQYLNVYEGTGLEDLPLFYSKEGVDVCVPTRCTVAIYSVDGRLIEEKASGRLSSGELPSGVYFLVIDRAGRRDVRKFVVVK